MFTAPLLVLALQPALPPLVGKISAPLDAAVVWRSGRQLPVTRVFRLRARDRVTVTAKVRFVVTLQEPDRSFAAVGPSEFVMEPKAIRRISGADPSRVATRTQTSRHRGRFIKSMAGIIRGGDNAIRPFGAFEGAPKLEWVPNPGSTTAKVTTRVADGNRVLWSADFPAGAGTANVPETAFPPATWVRLEVVQTGGSRPVVDSTFAQRLAPEEAAELRKLEGELRTQFEAEPGPLGLALGELWSGAGWVSRLPEALDLALPVRDSTQGARDWLLGDWLVLAGWTPDAAAAYRRAWLAGERDPALAESLQKLGVPPTLSEDLHRWKRYVRLGRGRDYLKLGETTLAALPPGAVSSEERRELEDWLAVTRRDAKVVAPARDRLVRRLAARGDTVGAAVAEGYELMGRARIEKPDERSRVAELITLLPDEQAYVRGMLQFRLTNEDFLEGRPLPAMQGMDRVMADLERSERFAEDSDLNRLIVQVAIASGQLRALINPGAAVPILGKALARVDRDPKLAYETTDILRWLLFARAIAPPNSASADAGFKEADRLRVEINRALALPGRTPTQVADAGMSASLAATFYVSVGRYEEALSLLGGLEDATRASSTELQNLPEVRTALASLGNIRFYLGDVFGSLALLEPVSQRELARPATTDLASLMLVGVYLSQNRVSEARAVFEAYRKVRPTGSSGTAGQRLSDLAQVALENTLKDALDALEGDLAALGRLSRPALISGARAIGGLPDQVRRSIVAPLYLRSGQAGRALPLLERQVEESRRTVPGSRDRSAAALNLAVALDQLGREEDAIQVLERAISELPADAAFRAGLRSNRLSLLLATGRSKDGVAEVPQIARDFVRELAELARSGNEAGLLAAGNASRDFLQLVATLATGGEVSPSEAYDVHLQLRGYATAATLRAAAAEKILRDDPRIRPLVERNGLARQAFAATASSTDPQVRATAPAREQAAREAESELARAMAERGFRVPDPVALSAIENALGKKRVLVEYVAYRRFDATVAGGDSPWKEERLGVFTVRGSGAPAWRDLGPLAPVRTMIQTWQTEIAGSEGDPERERLLRETSRSLHQALLAPLGTLPEELVIIPDGPLHGLAFEALVDRQNRYVIQNHRLRRMGSGRDLTEPAEAVPTGPAAVFAGPDYDLAAVPGTDSPTMLPSSPSTTRARDRSGQWTPLNAADREGTIVAERLNIEPVLGATATEERLLSIRRPSVLHIATHGFFADAPLPNSGGLGPEAADSPMLRSALILAGANRSGERHSAGLADGWVTALEVSQMDLKGTELVVLSACDAGLGDVRLSEGVFGLQRAFRVAGARSLIMSLFRVPDTSTLRLFEAFYSRWSPGRDRGERLRALRDAQLELLRKPETRHPLHWAGFVLLGDS